MRLQRKQGKQAQQQQYYLNPVSRQPSFFILIFGVQHGLQKL